MSAEPNRDIAHLSRIELLTPNFADSLWYFKELLGMAVTHREGRVAYLRGYGDYAAATLKLTESDRAGVGCISWRAASPRALERRAAAIERTGHGVGWSDGEFGHGPCYRFYDPDGHAMAVHYEEQRYRPPDGLRSTLRNLPMKYPAQGVGVRRTDHLALLCRDVAANRSFAQEILGCALREQVIYDNGTREIGAWLSTTPMHHEIAWVADSKGVAGRLHHIALWVDDKAEVLRAADIFMENGVTIETGPSKHNNSQAFYVYTYEPGGNRVEIYTSGFFVFAPDFEPVVWDETTRGGGVYWGAALPESFMTYGTPEG